MYLGAVISGDREVRHVRVRLAALVAFVVALSAFAAVPAFASAASIEVDTTLDEADVTSGSGACATEAGKCSLRAAIETSNVNPATPTNTITFDTPDVFGGARPASTITLLSPLPEIVEPVDIDAGTCPTALTPEGPCAEVEGHGLGDLESVFEVGADETTISNLAIEGGEDGVLVRGGKTGFSATGDWFGYELTTGGGKGGRTGVAGISLEPGADGATIGGDEVADRNVFGRSAVGVIVRGASDASIQGNYLGSPAGRIQPLPDPGGRHPGR